METPVGTGGHKLSLRTGELTFPNLTEQRWSEVRIQRTQERSCAFTVLFCRERERTGLRGRESSECSVNPSHWFHRESLYEVCHRQMNPQDKRQNFQFQ